MVVVAVVVSVAVAVEAEEAVAVVVIVVPRFTRGEDCAIHLAISLTREVVLVHTSGSLISAHTLVTNVGIYNVKRKSRQIC